MEGRSKSDGRKIAYATENEYPVSVQQNSISGGHFGPADRWGFERAS